MERDREDRSVLASWQGPETSGMSSLYMLIFMGALGVFFAVGIVVFLLYGFTSSASAGMDPLYLPVELWASTLVLILTSWVMYSMERAARQGAYDAMGRWMHRTWGLSLLFVIIQVPALSELLRRQRSGWRLWNYLCSDTTPCTTRGRRYDCHGHFILEDTRWSLKRIACSSGANVCPILAFSFRAMGRPHGRISHG